MARQNLRAVPVTSTVSACINDAYSALCGLRDEANEIVENAPEGLGDTDRISTFTETVDALSEADSEPDIPECVAEIVVTYTEDRRKSKSHSRATQCAEACEVLSAAVAALDEWLDDDANKEHADRDDVDQLKNDVEEFMGNAEGTSWPGMFG